MLQTDTATPMDGLEKRFVNMARLVDEASLLLDADSTVIAANEMALDLLGQHIIGYPLDRFLRHPDFADAVRVAAEEEKFSTMEYTRMDQIRRNFFLRFAPFEEDYVLLVILDGTMMQSVERIRSDFVANVSHELRSPLTALSGFIETLQDGAIDDHDSRDHFLSIMQTEAGRMQRLIDDLLSLSRVEAEEHRTPQDEVHLQMVLQEMISVMSNMAAQNDQHFALEIAEPLEGQSLAVFGSADELRQVFQNLAENAIRYGYRDSVIKVEVSGGLMAGGQPAADLLRVRIINDGDDIPSEHLARLTERFYRIDKGRSRQMGGTGLGLAIVKHIINRHRGRFRMLSEGNKTIASVTLRRFKPDR